jgi:hypothetical protein
MSRIAREMVKKSTVLVWNVDAAFLAAESFCYI